MRILRLYFFVLICLLMLGGFACQRKGLSCPKPTGKSVLVGDGLEAIQVKKDKNGRVKKRN